MAEVIWTGPALRHLREIEDYVRQDSPQRAERLTYRLLQAPQRLEAFPLSGRVVPELDNLAYREIIV